MRREHTENRVHALTDTLVVVNVLVFVLVATQDMHAALIDRYAFSLARLAAGHWEVLITSGFLHSGPAHLLYNITFLWVFGRTCEDVFGTVRTGLIYVTAMVAGSLFFGLLFPAESAVGASGAVSGMIAAAILTEPGRDIYPGVASFPIVFLAFAFLLPTALNAFNLAGNTANIAHVGGAVAGAAYALLWRRDDALQNMKDLWILWLVIGAVLVLLVVSALIQV